MKNNLLASKTLPLYNKRILITAPRNYVSRLATEIINYGGVPIIMPTIETCYLSSYKKLDNCLNNISQFNYIAFTSRNGINALINRLETLNIPRSYLDNCQLIAIGKDAQRLKEMGLKVAIMPKEPSPLGIVSELAKIDNIEKQSILIPIPQVIGISEPDIIPNFITALERLGMKINPVYAYQTRCLETSLYDMEIDLIKQGKIDVIAFSSTAEIESFLQLVNNTQLFKQCLIACFGPYTAGNARKLGLTVDIVGKDYHSFTGFVEAIADYLTPSNSSEIYA
ncbi:uroporphyrinogen-III synthase [Crocosphaera chwakensis]|uniref:Uroporphyrinogen-III synthase n=1 Tax=Crocosphaera chwakensis CCY0110 TaxID=391612 RepID=A3IKV9_9CHRO|nr:uroporphyrinogen-III synthase [Crocosphaera chwakensis]EAZ92828.1 uroporphyrinogen-III synthase [Crocosphaera chwakensis CCY0110]